MKYLSVGTLTLTIATALCCLATVDALECGTIEEYWSTTCGMIGSPQSRVCNRGGELVSPQSCTTHFHKDSRPCGFLRLGCQSRCKRAAKPCRAGELSFVQREFALHADINHVHVAVLRSRGQDGPASVTVDLDEPADWFEPVPLEWETQDAHPKHAVVSIPPSMVGQEIKLLLRDPVGATLSAPSSFTMVSGVDNPSLHTESIRPTACQFRANESDGFIPISFERLIPSGDDPSKLPEFTISLKVIGGTATPVADYNLIDEEHPLTVHWLAGEVGVQTALIVVADDDDAELDETIELVPINYQFTSADSCAVITAVILNDDAVDHALRVSKIQKLSAALKITLDRPEKEQFLGEFQTRMFDKGHLFFRRGTEMSNEMYVIQTGSVDLIDETDGTADIRLFGGDSFGELAMLYDFPRQRTVIAHTAVTVWIMDQETYQRFVADDDDIRSELEANLVQDFIRRQARKPPVLLFPGLASSQMIAWKRKECRGFNVHVGDVVWVSVEKIVQTLTVDANCWLDCLKLSDNQTDSEGCRLRAGEGLGALQDLIPGITFTTIFGEIVKTLAAEYNYDSNSLLGFPYDWRLSPDMLESRDGYFSKLKRGVETAVAYNGAPAIAICHSQGNSVLLHFVTWLDNEVGKEASIAWMEQHIDGYFGLGAPLLGAGQPVRSLLSGVPMGLPISNYNMKVLSQSLGSLPWFFPVHEDLSKSIDSNNDVSDHLPRHPSPLSAEASEALSTIVRVSYLDGSSEAFTSNDVASGRLFDVLGSRFNDSGLLRVENLVRKNYNEFPLSPLLKKPQRPPIKNIFMLYGIDLETEVAYDYEENSDGLALKASLVESAGGVLTRNGATVETVGVNEFHRSGDQTVPYHSLAWAHSWHSCPVEQIAVETVPSKTIQYYSHPIGKFSESVFTLMNTLEPEYTRYSSEDSLSGTMTNVIEISKLEHREIVKDPFTMKLFRQLFIATTINEINSERNVLGLLKKSRVSHTEL